MHEVLALFMYEPALQSDLQDGRPFEFWYWPLGQPVHVDPVCVFDDWYCPLEQALQPRFLVDDGTTFCLVPAAHFE